LWRAGNLSDRATALLLVRRMPVLLAILWLAGGGRIDTLLILVPIGFVIWKVGYGWLLADLRDKRAELRSARS
jgi:hypothetical protein